MDEACPAHLATGNLRRTRIVSANGRFQDILHLEKQKIKGGVDRRGARHFDNIFIAITDPTYPFVTQGNLL